MPNEVKNVTTLMSKLDSPTSTCISNNIPSLKTATDTSTLTQKDSYLHLPPPPLPLHNAYNIPNTYFNPYQHYYNPILPPISYPPQSSSLTNPYIPLDYTSNSPMQTPLNYSFPTNTSIVGYPSLIPQRLIYPSNPIPKSTSPQITKQTKINNKGKDNLFRPF
jgi:hypothetical protein